MVLSLDSLVTVTGVISTSLKLWVARKPETPWSNALSLTLPEGPFARNHPDS